MRASSVVNCQSTLARTRSRDACQAATSVRRTLIESIRRPRHWRITTLSSISATFSQLPCLGV